MKGWPARSSASGSGRRAGSRSSAQPRPPQFRQRGCGGDRFDHQIWLVNGIGPRIERFREFDVAGADIVRRFRETRQSSLHRYYG